MKVQFYNRMNVETGEKQEIRIRRDNIPWAEMTHAGVDMSQALVMINNWNRIASLTNVSKWRYWA